ncbi:hypothetical protein M9H77_00105 [Catharanthus roseus]|nr:hypothetical protein M9H77_00105 [Catharanthus roseus]
MTCASHIIRQSTKIRSTSKSVWNNHALLIRCLSNDARVSADKGDDILKFKELGFASPSGCSPSIGGFSKSCAGIFPSKISTVGTHNASAIRTPRKADSPMAGMFSNAGPSWSGLAKGRSFSTDSGEIFLIVIKSY